MPVIYLDSIIICLTADSHPPIQVVAQLLDRESNPRQLDRKSDTRPLLLFVSTMWIKLRVCYTIKPIQASKVKPDVAKCVLMDPWRVDAQRTAPTGTLTTNGGLLVLLSKQRVTGKLLDTSPTCLFMPVHNIHCRTAFINCPTLMRFTPIRHIVMFYKLRLTSARIPAFRCIHLLKNSLKNYELLIKLLS